MELKLSGITKSYTKGKKRKNALEDFSVERVFEKTRIAEKIVFGLSFSFDQVEKISDCIPILYFQTTVIYFLPIIPKAFLK